MHLFHYQQIILVGLANQALLNKIAEYASASGFVFKDGFVLNALRELSFGLCRVYCVLYKRSLYALGRVSSNATNEHKFI